MEKHMLDGPPGKSPNIDAPPAQPDPSRRGDPEIDPVQDPARRPDELPPDGPWRPEEVPPFRRGDPEQPHEKSGEDKPYPPMP